MKCKLVAVLEKKILGLEWQVEMLLRIREAEEFLDSQIQETPVLQIQERKELAIKESGGGGGRGSQRGCLEVCNQKRSWQYSILLNTDEDGQAVGTRN